MSVFERMSLARSRAFKGATRVFNGITVCNNKYIHSLIKAMVNYSINTCLLMFLGSVKFRKLVS